MRASFGRMPPGKRERVMRELAAGRVKSYSFSRVRDKSRSKRKLVQRFMRRMRLDPQYREILIRMPSLQLRGILGGE
jgi:hypothetical protein